MKHTSTTHDCMTEYTGNRCIGVEREEKRAVDEPPMGRLAIDAISVCVVDRSHDHCSFRKRLRDVRSVVIKLVIDTSAGLRYDCHNGSDGGH